MNKKTKTRLIIGIALGALALSFSSKTVRKKVKRTVTGEEKSKLAAIKEILEDKDDTKKNNLLKDKFDKITNKK